MNPHLLQQVAGHTTFAMTQHSLHVPREEVRDALAAPSFATGPAFAASATRSAKASTASAACRATGTCLRLALDNGVRSQSHQKPLFGKKSERYWRSPLASRHIARFQSRQDLLVWQLYGRRTDGLPEGVPSHKFAGSS